MLGFIGGLLGIVLAQIGLLGVRQSYEYYKNIATMDLAMLLSAPVIALFSLLPMVIDKVAELLKSLHRSR